MATNGQIPESWQPDNYLLMDKIPEGQYVIMILNRPMRLDPYYVIHLWNKAFMRVTVDGGTDVWLNFKRMYCKTIPVKDIDLVTGDFDSISDEALAIVQKKNKDHVIHTPDQNETDFTKALRTLEPFIANTIVKSILVVAESSGRIDQIMANINTLHKAKTFSACRIYILANNSFSFLIQPGHHRISTIPDLVKNQDWCSLIPFTNKATVTTTGLKWNLNNQVMQFGGLLTTSNTFDKSAKEVTVTTDVPLLWSMGVTKH